MQRNSWRWDLTVSALGNLSWYSSSGGLLCWVGAVTGQWNSVSDMHRKARIEPMSPVLDKLMQVRMSSYAFRHDETGRRYLGTMAQEIAPLFPEVVRSHEDHYGLSYGQLAVIALKALQEQQQLIDYLETEVARLEATKK
ncbi:MAG: tail fiber domain-containing protein, partial [Saprospiraceae bacterium]|nr:tail fiber domain-containing protein [Saprospiraceae bacterium]